MTTLQLPLFCGGLNWNSVPQEWVMEYSWFATANVPGAVISIGPWLELLGGGSTLELDSSLELDSWELLDGGSLELDTTLLELGVTEELLGIMLHGTNIPLKSHRGSSEDEYCGVEEELRTEELVPEVGELEGLEVTELLDSTGLATILTETHSPIS